MTSKVLLIGKNGFVAKSFSNTLSKNNIKFQSLSKSNIDLTNHNECKKLSSYTSKYVIFFFAAITPDKGKDEKVLIKNIKMISNFFDFFPISNIAHFNYISSDAVYSSKQENINPHTHTNPDDLYGLMHIVREKIVQSKLTINQVTILRLTAIYGYGDTHNSYGPNRFINQAINDGEIKLFGDGMDKRDHLHIDDLIKILLVFMKKKTPGTFIIATGNSMSFKSIAKKISQIFNKKFNKTISLKFINNNNKTSIRKFSGLDKIIKSKIKNSSSINYKLDKYISNLFS